MAIAFSCVCGAALNVKDELAGRRAKCPTCGQALTVPGAAVSRVVPPPAKAPAVAARATSVSREPRKTQVNPFAFSDNDASKPPQQQPPARTTGGVRRPSAPPVISSETADSAPLRLKEMPVEADPLALQVSHGAGSAQQPAATQSRAVAPKPPPLFLEKASKRSALSEYGFYLMALALLPLGFSLFQDDDNVAKRFEQTLSHVSPEVQKKIEALNDDPDAEMNDLFVLLPSERLEGAHLSRLTWVHWIYACMSAAAFLAMIVFLFPQGNAQTADLIKVGLFTGTIGILFLLAVQWIAAWSAMFSVRGFGKLTFIIWIVQFIGFSYRCALDPSNGFLLSFLGFTCGVGLCEELCKGWPVMRHFVNKATLDWRGACVWGLASGVGFGVSEGITYSSDYYNGVSGGDIYVIRFVSCVALHAIWAGSIGIGFFRYQHSYQGGLSAGEMIVPVLRNISVPMILHGLYDTLLKKEMPGWAVIIAVLSFAFLAFQIERQKREEESESPAVPSMA